MIIEEYSNSFSDGITDFILSIQQEELHVPITVADQPDLRNISAFYQRGNGNFWIAIDNGNVVGTIGLIDIGNSEVALRKMFVHSSCRGSEKATAQRLLDRVFEWCSDRKLRNIFLGTIDIMKAAHRFYERNGFVVVEKYQLPGSFPVMKVDNVFYKYSFLAE